MVEKPFLNNYLPEGLCPGINEDFHFEKGLYPVAEKLQPQMMQFKCNYRNMEDAKKNANILNKKLEEIIRDKIKNNVSPRHVPKKIFQVNEIPRTKSGKIVELAVRDVIHGREIKNIEAIANPDSLQYFSNLDIY